METMYSLPKKEIPVGSACCFTGNRPQKLPWHNNEYDSDCIKAKQKLLNICETLIIEKNLLGESITHFMCGMALGADFYFAETILSLKEKYPFITLQACLPCQQQEHLWSKEHKEKYRFLLNQCDEVSVARKVYDVTCMQARNKYMVDHSQVLIGLCYAKGGAMSTMRYAAGKGKKIIDMTL